MFSSKFRKRSQKSQLGYEPEEMPEKRNAKPEGVSSPTIFELEVSKRQKGHATIVIRVPAPVCLVASDFDMGNLSSSEPRVACGPTIAHSQHRITETTRPEPALFKSNHTRYKHVVEI